HARQFQTRIGLEAEAPVIAGITEKNAAFGSSLAQLRETFADKLAAYPLALPVRADRNGTKPVPAFILIADLNRRESDMAQNPPVLFGNQRQGERLCGAKRID